MIVRPDGEKRNVVITAAPWFDRNGNFVGAFGLFRDVTLRKRAERRLELRSRLAAVVMAGAGLNTGDPGKGGMVEVRLP